MTDFLNTLSFNVRVSQVDGETFRVNTRRNVKKPIVKILYLEQPPSGSVNLSYVGSDGLSSAKNLYIGDRSDELYTNSRTNTISEFLAPSSPIGVKTRNFLVTQVYNTAESGNIPLYFKHKIDTSFDAVIPESVRLYDQDFNEISRDKFKLELQYEYDETDGSKGDPTHYELFNSLESFYDDATGQFAVYFIQYTDSSGTSDVTRTILLENEKAYKEASFGDIWGETSKLKPWEKVYTIDEDSSVFVEMADTGLPTFVRYEESNRVRVAPPVELSSEQPWYLRVLRGSFNSRYGPYSLSYKIPEFSSQSFSPMEPYKTSVYGDSIVISDNLIKFPHQDIQSGAIFSSLYVIIQDAEDNVVYAITDDVVKAGDDYIDFDGNRVYDSSNSTIKWSSDLLLGLDRLSGIVQIDAKLSTDYKVFSTYSYEEDSYSVSSINMNPVFDTAVASELRVLYLNPSNCPTYPSSVSSQTEAIKWLKVSTSGRILSTNQNGLDGNEDISKDVQLTDDRAWSIDNVVGLHYSWRAITTSESSQVVYSGIELNVSTTDGFPGRGWIRFVDNTSNTNRYAYYSSKTPTSFSVEQGPGEAYGITAIDGSRIELVNFIDERSTVSNRDYNTELERQKSSDTIPVHCSQYFVLAETSINPPHSVKEAVQIDVRQNGGGIILDKYDAAKKRNPKVQWYSDNGNYEGQVYPGRGAILIKLPISILKQFSEGQLNDIIESNIPFGMVPLIRYYGYQPEITNIVPLSDEWGFGEGPFAEYYFGGTL